MLTKEVLTPHPFLFPFICMEKLDTWFPPRNLTKNCISWCNIVIRITMFSLIPIFFILNHMASLSTESKSFSESTKHQYIHPLFVPTCFNYRNVTFCSSSCNRYGLNSKQSVPDNTVVSLVSCLLVFLNIYSTKLIIMTPVRNFWTPPNFRSLNNSFILMNFSIFLEIIFLYLKIT